jgi:hypothetical protein
MLLKGKYMKFRFLLPGVYILLVLLFFAFFLKGAGGHGWNPFDFNLFGLPSRVSIGTASTFAGSRWFAIALAFHVSRFDPVGTHRLPDG